MVARRRIKCDCGHWRTSHYDYVRDNKYGCRAVNPDGTLQGCKCLRDQRDVKRLFGRAA